MTDNQSFYSRSLDNHLLATVRKWGEELGFQAIGFTGIDLKEHRSYLERWLAAGHHGDMTWMKDLVEKRTHPEALIPGTCTIITARMDYLPSGEPPESILNSPSKGYISRYAVGRDYHKLMRPRLAKLAKRINSRLGKGQYRAFVDSAPILERALAENAGLGWIGKNTMLINKQAGSWFFLGEIYTDITIPPDPPTKESHCGTCTACLDICPTNAFKGPGVLDARRCISYLTIEHKGIIPEALRPLMGNRIYGCDDCQLVCPWNKFAVETKEPDFMPRHEMDSPDLIALAKWDENAFLKKTQGSPIRRIGFERWLRNLAIALGNAPTSPQIKKALFSLKKNASPMVLEHIEWALTQHKSG